MFEEVIEGCEILKDQEKRKGYDMWRKLFGYTKRTFDLP